MKARFYVTYVVCLVACILQGVAAQDRVTADDALAFAIRAARMRAAWWLVEPRREGLPAAVAAEARVQLAKVLVLPGASDDPMVRHLMMRAEFLWGRVDKGVEILFSTRAASMLPESIGIIMTQTARTHRDQIPYEDLLADLVPLSMWRESTDERRSQRWVFEEGFDGPVFSDAEWPFVPMPDRREALQIASCLEQAGLWELAWRAYAEAIYGTFGPLLTTREINGGWLSPQVAEYWIEAAQCARRAGRTALAWDYLMKAAVAGSDGHYADALVVAQDWAAEPEPPAPPPVDPVVRREALTRAVRLYAAMNAHPRSLTLLEEYPEAFEDPEGLCKEVEAHWLDIVRKSSSLTTQVTLYGYEVYPGGDPLAVRMPWALSDEALASARERLAAVLAAAQAAEEPQEE